MLAAASAVRSGRRGAANPFLVPRNRDFIRTSELATRGRRCISPSLKVTILQPALIFDFCLNQSRGYRWAGPNWTLVHCAPRRCPDMVVVRQGRPLDLILAHKAIGF